jgi:anthranilate 1,2-dioxygenase small subunit
MNKTMNSTNSVGLEYPQKIQLDAFLAQYAYELDDGNVESWLHFFAPTGVYELTTAYNVSCNLPLGIMHCKGHGMMVDRVRALLTANIFELHKYTHIVTNPIAEKRGDVIISRSNFIVYRTMESGLSHVFATGKYMDQIIETDDGMKFLERKVVIDSKRIDTLIVYPI